MTGPKFTPEAEVLADTILRAAGSGLRHYSMAKTREAILAAAQQGIDAAKAKPLDALRQIEANSSDCGPSNGKTGDSWIAARAGELARSAIAATVKEAA